MPTEYFTYTGKVTLMRDGKYVKNLENILNEYAKLGFELVSLYQYIFDGLQFSLVMKRTVQ